MFKSEVRKFKSESLLKFLFVVSSISVIVLTQFVITVTESVVGF